MDKRNRSATRPADTAVSNCSPDGSQIAVHVLEGDSGVTVFDWQLQPRAVWIYGVSPVTRTRLTLDPAPIGASLWTPDGTSVVYATVHDGQRIWMRQAVDGSSPPRHLATLPPIDPPRTFNLPTPQCLVL